MISHRQIFLPLAIAIAVCASSAFGQEKREELIQRITAAQGVTEMFEQQLAQQRESLRGYGAKLLNDLAAQSGGQPSAQGIEAFERFLGQGAQMFSAKELSSKWVENYGANLSVSDLREILKYYESSIGKKDVAASKSAMAAFSVWMNTEGQSRTTVLVTELVRELQQANR